MPRETKAQMEERLSDEYVGRIKKLMEDRDELRSEVKNQESIIRQWRERDDRKTNKNLKLEEAVRKLTSKITNLQDLINQLQDDNYYTKWKDAQNRVIELEKSVGELTAPYKERIASLEQSLGDLSGACAKHIIQMIKGD